MCVHVERHVMWRKMGKTVPWVKMTFILCVPVVYAIVNDDIKMT